MTEAIKVQARYGLLLEQTDKTAGDFANTQDSFANSQRRLAANIENVAATIGAELLPVVADATDELADFSGAIGDSIGPISTFFGWMKRISEIPISPFAQFKRIWEGIAAIPSSVGGGFSSLNDDIAETMDTTLTFAGLVPDLTDALSDAGEAANEAEKEGLKNFRGGLDRAVLDLERFGDTAKSETELVIESWQRMRDELSLEQTMVRAAQSFATAMEGMQGDTLEQIESVAEMKAAVIDFALAAEDVPEEVVTELIALIDEGAYRVVDTRLKVLASNRSMTISVRVDESQIPPWLRPTPTRPGVRTAPTPAPGFTPTSPGEPMVFNLYASGNVFTDAYVLDYLWPMLQQLIIEQIQENQ